MSPGSWSRVTNGLNPPARDPPGRGEGLAGGGYGHPDGGTLTTRRLALPGRAVAAVVAGLQALVFHHRGHGRRGGGLKGRPRLSAPGRGRPRRGAGGPRREGRERGGFRVRDSPPDPRTGLRTPA